LTFFCGIGINYLQLHKAWQLKSLNQQHLRAK
jgi:hypothetical protein